MLLDNLTLQILQSKLPIKKVLKHCVVALFNFYSLYFLQLCWILAIVLWALQNKQEKKKLFWIKNVLDTAKFRMYLNLQPWCIFMRMTELKLISQSFQMHASANFGSCYFGFLFYVKNLLGLSTDSYDLSIKICYCMYIARVGTMVSENTRGSWKELQIFKFSKTN